MTSPAVPPATPRIACMGEALIDLVGAADGRFTPCLGGAPYNLARAMARLGVGVSYLNPLSADAFGQQLAAGLLAEGVTLAHPEPVQPGTALALARPDDAGKVSYGFYMEGVAFRTTTASALIDACLRLPDLRAVATGCLALAPGDRGIVLPWLAAMRQAGKTVVVDANLRPGAVADLPAYRDSVRATLALADIIKVSDEDLDALDPQGHTGSDAATRAQHLMTTGPARLVLLTAGAHGCSAYAASGAQWHYRDPQAVTVVDTIGAGDCFLAGFLAAWLDTPEDSAITAHVPALLREATACASINVGRVGCNPPTRADVQASLSCQRLEQGRD